MVSFGEANDRVDQRRIIGLATSLDVIRRLIQRLDAHHGLLRGGDGVL